MNDSAGGGRPCGDGSGNKWEEERRFGQWRKGRHDGGDNKYGEHGCDVLRHVYQDAERAVLLAMSAVMVDHEHVGERNRVESQEQQGNNSDGTPM